VLCHKCNEDQAEDAFYLRKTGKRVRPCKECMKRASRAFHAAHRADCIAKNREWKRAHLEECRNYSAEYRKRHPEVNRETARRFRTNRREDWLRRRREERDRRGLAGRLRVTLSCRICNALKVGTKKSAGTLELVGCSIQELRAWLARQFRPGMTWDNYGPVWHIDHRKPCASFNLADPAQQRVCFHYSNLQPLFALENLQKGARIW
jgi:hypothetical protein